MMLSFSELSPQIKYLWAKSNDADGHPLLAHMLDVAAVVEVILECEPETTHQILAKQFGFTQDIPRWFAALAGLHDIGKATPGFQNKWQEGRQRVEAQGLPFNARWLRATRHDWSSAAILKEWLPKHIDVDREWCFGVIDAVSAHHGYPLFQREKDAGLPVGEDLLWKKVRHQVLDTYWRVLVPKGVVSDVELRLSAINWLAGLTSIADWIGSNTEWFPLGERYDRLDDYYRDAKALARYALMSIGWTSYAPLLDETLSIDTQMRRILDAKVPVSPRPLQEKGIALLQEGKGPTLLLVEAPMGEGKTELAFLAHLHLQRTNAHRGFYIALPTQATGNALFSRTQLFLRAFAKKEGEVALQLVHGGAARRERILALSDIGRDINSRREGGDVARWFAQRKRPLIAPYGVGTIDQALFSVLNVKHHFVRLWGLSNRVVVLDEIHAYDEYTEGLIETLLRWLRELGCSVVLMSATLPTKRRNALLQAWDADASDLPKLNYPRVVAVDDRGIRWDDDIASRSLAPVTLSGCGTALDSILETVLRALSNGGCGAVIVNTVERAQRLFTMVRASVASDVKLLLFHARFPADERSALEEAVLSIFGKKGERPVKALLIATQVVEQSLDIDFDFLISDLAPVDLLLQRVGRLHRHQRVNRPVAHQQPLFTVSGLLPGDLPDLKTTGWQFVYEPYFLAMTWAQLLKERTLELPKDIDRLVQEVYSGEQLPEGIERATQQYIEEACYSEYLSNLHDKRQRAANIVVNADDDPASAYLNKLRGHEEGESRDKGLINCTRLGNESICVIPLFGLDVKVVSLAKEGGTFNLDEPLTEVQVRALCARQISISNQGLVHMLKAKAIPRAFDENALLRYSYPLLLNDDGVAQLDGTLSVRLDKELGLVYQRKES